MQPNRLIWILCLLFLLQNAEAQEKGLGNIKDWPIKAPIGTPAGQEYNKTQVIYGYILTKDNDTLRGRLKIVPFWGVAFFYVYVLPEGKQKGEDILNIYRARIRSVRAYS